MAKLQESHHVIKFRLGEEIALEVLCTKVALSWLRKRLVKNVFAKQNYAFILALKDTRTNILIYMVGHF